ncbi:MAG: NAD+ synthase [Candidatus Omnitrophica bacterium]|nr:NAD+ synthase [Candidatus Omnitrophota bacterium]
MKSLINKTCRIILSALFLLSSVLPVDYARAQAVASMPSATELVTLSVQYAPTIVRGLSVYPDNPLKFDFIIDTGDQNLSGADFKKESEKLIKYFLAALTVPEKELWVNLSPYEKNRVIPDGLGQTQMGSDMLAQDYLLKKITASLLYPEGEVGKKFWDRAYKKAYEKFGTTDIPVDAFNKVWIAPDKAVVYEKGNKAFVVERHLKVLMEEDYKALKQEAENKDQPSNKKSLSTQMIKEIIIPELEKEVNTGKNFAALRQIYNSLILASWYKKQLQNSFLGKVYANANKTSGVNAEDLTQKKHIYEQYLETFRKGVFNLIKEEYDVSSQQIIPRKYFSGGLAVGAASANDLVVLKGDLAMLPRNVKESLGHPDGKDQQVTWEAVAKKKRRDKDPVEILDAHEVSFLPINPVADFEAREFPDIKIADRKGRLSLLIDISDDLKTLTYYQVLDDSKVFTKDGAVHYETLNESNGSIRKIASFPSSYLVSPRKWMLKHFKNSSKGKLIEQIWPQGKRYTRYKGITTSWDMDVDKDVWTTNIDTIFLHQRLFQSGALSLPKNKIKKAAEIGSGGGHLSALLAKSFPKAQISITDISSYALSTTLLNIIANHPQGRAFLDHVKKYWGKGIAVLEDNQDLIVVNPPYVPIAPFEKNAQNDPYRGTGLIREIIKDGWKKLNPNNPEAAIYIDISSLAMNDVRQYLDEFGDNIVFEPVGKALEVPLKIRWMSEEWKQWLLKENGGLKHVENPRTDQEEYYHTLQTYRIRIKKEAPKAKRIAIIGGTFDPLHVAHRKMIEDVKQELNVDEVIVVPTNVSPHKQGKFSAPKEIRYKIAQAAVAGMPGVKVSSFDIDREGPSYTIDLVNHIRAQYPEKSKFFFIIGDDNIEKLDTWKNIDELAQKVHFVTYTRPGQNKTNPRIKVERIERPGIDISATMIRQRVALGLPLTGFVSPEVEQIIAENELYMPEDIFPADKHDPIYSLNGQPFKDDKPFTVITDAHGTLLKPAWKEEYAHAFASLSGHTTKEGMQWIEKSIIAQMVDTTRDVPFEEIVTLLHREISLLNIQKTREEIIEAISEARKYYENSVTLEAMPGAHEAIKNLKDLGIPIKVVTSRDSGLIYQQLKNAGFGDVIELKDIFGRDRQDALPIKEEENNYTLRERMIKNLMEQSLGRRAIVLDDWIESARITKDLGGIFVALPQGEDRSLEQKRNYNRLKGENAALEITNTLGWKRLVSLIKVLNSRREDKLRTMQTKNVRTALLQFNPTVGDMVDNYTRLAKAIDTAETKNVDLLVSPELAITGYLPGDLLLNREFIDQNRALVKLLAAKTKGKGITVVVGFVDINKYGQIYNALAVLSDGEVKGVYRKRALPNYGVFFEKRYFIPGELGLFDFEGNPLNKDIFNIDGLMFSVNDCEDIWVEKDGVKHEFDGHSVQEPVDHHVIAPYKEQAEKGARLIINSSASPYREGVLKTRENLVAKRAKDTGATFIYLNTVGGQDEVVFDGNSMVISPDGKVVARGKPFEEDMLVMDLPVKTEKRTESELAATIPVNKLVKDSDKVDLPPIAEVTPPTRIELIFKGLILGLRDYMRKNGITDVIFGNSGGIDSGVTGALAAIALGPEHVHSMSLPTRFNSSETKSDARKLAENLKIGFEEVPIESVFKEALATLLPTTPSSKPLSQATQIAIENIQARLRMVFLMFRSNADGYLLLSTSNKSESAVGYTTIYGDMSGGLALIKDVSKSDIFELARYINKYLGKEIIPESMINRPPSAELREDQKDEDSLPKYQTELDPILKELVENNLSIKEVAKKTGLPLKMVTRVRKMLDKAEWKRRQAPIGIKLTRRAFGHHERRVPITNRYDSEQVENFINSVKQNSQDAAMASDTKGGIDFDPSMMNLEIKKDAKGIPLPIYEQPLEEAIKIDGFSPLILAITPINVVELINH